MNTTPPFDDFVDQIFQNMRAKYGDIGLPIKTPEGKSRVDLLEKNPEKDSFYLVIDLQKLKICWQSNLFETTQYTHLTLKDFFKSIHPGFLEWFLVWAVAGYESIPLMRAPLSEGKSAYTILIPFQIKDSRYWWVKQLSEPLYLDTNKKMVWQLNTYRLISPYDGQDPEQPFIRTGTNLRVDLTERTIEEVKHYFLNSWFGELSPTQMNILMAYWHLSKYGHPTTMSEMEKKLNIPRNTIMAANKRIKELANTKMPVRPNRFREAREVGAFLESLFGIKS